MPRETSPLPRGSPPPRSRHHDRRTDRDRGRSPARGRRDRRSRSRSPGVRDRHRDRRPSPPGEGRGRSRSPTDEGGRGGGSYRSPPAARGRSPSDRYGRDHARGREVDRDGAGSKRSGGKRDRVRGDASPSDTKRHRESRVGGAPSKDRQPLGAVDSDEEGGDNAVKGPAVKTQPQSLEELVKKRQEELVSQSKPVFISKKERERLALERRKQEAAEKVSATMSAHKERVGGGGDDPRDRDHRGGRSREGGGGSRSRADRGDYVSERDRRRGGRGGQEDEASEKQKKLESLRAQYLGVDRSKRKMLKPSEKFRFSFDWDAEDDTSKDLNPMYSSLKEITPLYGRGFIAGVDRREQKKQQLKHEQYLLDKLRQSNGISTTQLDERKAAERSSAADRYDGFGMQVQTHWSDKKLKDMTERDWRIFREDNNISYRGSVTVDPMRNWDEADIPRRVLRAIKEVCNYEKPSPIQMAAIPIGLAQLDVIGLAETGSGKTAAFVIPMLKYIMGQPPMVSEDVCADGPYAIVLAPSRELAQQIEVEAKKLATYTNFRVASIVGGLDINKQGSILRQGVEIVVATPGRLLDCIEQRYCVLNQCNYVVLDEADRMIDMGFEPQVIAVLDKMPAHFLKPEDEQQEIGPDTLYRTTYMFSATMPTSVERLAKKYLRRAVVVQVGTTGQATENITQRVFMVKDNDKLGRLQQELRHLPLHAKVIVFVNTKRHCDDVQRSLEEGWDDSGGVAVLHGGKSQDQREAAIQGLRDGDVQCLIATDVLSRGIDVPDVALVVNYDMCEKIEQYTHRIGRTGRAGKKGTAITFLTLNDTAVFYDLKKMLIDSNANVPGELARHEASRIKPGGFEGGGGRPMFTR